jgi:prefoldin subunit 5
MTSEEKLEATRIIQLLENAIEILGSEIGQGKRSLEELERKLAELTAQRDESVKKLAALRALYGEPCA